MAIQDLFKLISRIFLLLVLLGGGMLGIWYSARGLSAAKISAAQVYAVLGPSALAFVLFGIFVTAFISVDSRLDKLLKLLEEMRKLLSARALDHAPGKEGSHSDAGGFEAIEKQIRQLRNRMEATHEMTSRMETTLETLRKETEAAPAAPGGSPAPVMGATTNLSPETSRRNTEPPPAATNAQERPQALVEDDPDAPAWRKALNNIIEDIESEGEKK